MSLVSQERAWTGYVLRPETDRKLARKNNALIKKRQRTLFPGLVSPGP